MNPACTIKANIVQVIFVCNVVSDVFRQHRLDEIPMQCWEPLLQHCTGFLPMQYFPKSIKTTLNRIFLVQGCLGPQRQLYIRFFLGNAVPEDDSSGKYCTEQELCAAFALGFQTKIQRKKSSSMLSEYSWNSIVRVKSLYNVV